MESARVEKADESSGSVCPGCGKRFRCGVEAGLKTCWCMERPPFPAGSASDGGAHCFCPDCLDKRRADYGSSR